MPKQTERLTQHNVDAIRIHKRFTLKNILCWLTHDVRSESLFGVTLHNIQYIPFHSVPMANRKHCCKCCRCCCCCWSPYHFDSNRSLGFALFFLLLRNDEKANVFLLIEMSVSTQFTFDAYYVLGPKLLYVGGGGATESAKRQTQNVENCDRWNNLKLLRILFVFSSLSVLP